MLVQHVLYFAAWWLRSLYQSRSCQEKASKGRSRAWRCEVLRLRVFKTRSLILVMLHLFQSFLSRKEVQWQWFLLLHSQVRWRMEGCAVRGWGW
ncbi:hypothetical protein P154DRAFT_244620 [Amniculicola lignicola CBS 123094]|uniref:Uncharacterized protein n=1 Tax=Amniculicola lignicola CBS 123094 TaxID=1392246 RepID=A0A6A5WCF0_9PLEO|nr:hypothetical protein P154DRAFT_244620 [Amniculicola lignicola CBS 123094]